ncbi:hypothetical protein [Alloactinosynnema sp. L-07]|nr:hypothetical protein [Alloactinosynnema sp. L-07]
MVGGIVHESSTYAAGVDGFAVHVGADLVAEFAGTETVVGGYLAACVGVEVVGALHARAEPAGVVPAAVYADLEARLVARLPDSCDVVLLDLHGAGVVEPDESLDVRVLRAVRAALPDAVIAVTMDLHGNLTQDVVDLADVVVGCKLYPHTDLADQAKVAARIAFGAAASGIRPDVRLVRLPMVLPPSTTDSGPAAELAELTRAAETEPGVLACTVFHGFPYADTPQAGASLVTVCEPGTPVSERVPEWLWDNRSRFRQNPTTAEEAVMLALAGPAPAVIGDAADNPGGGATGTETGLLRAILAAGVDACFATIHDPATVAQAIAAGVGATIDACLADLPVTATVRAVTDGRVVGQSMRRGKAVDFGPSVRLTVGRVEVIVATHRLQVFDPEILLLHGVMPDRYAVVGVKSAHHFRSGFAAVAGQLLTADAGGLTTGRIESLPRPGPSRHLWPMNSERKVISWTR